MAKETFRSGGELDDEDSVASRAAGIREGQIIQTHNAIQEALARAETAAAQSDPVIPPGIFPDYRPGKGNYNPELFSANEALLDAISDREAVEGPDPRGAKRRPGFAPIAPQEIAAEAAAGEVPQADAGSALADESNQFLALWYSILDLMNLRKTNGFNGVDERFMGTVVGERNNQAIMQLSSQVHHLIPELNRAANDQEAGLFTAATGATLH